jgi:AraC family transcriptional regulator of adaptative response / DNA-3-methyladenine glycosylase II
VRVILGQQVTVKAALHADARLVRALAQPLSHALAGADPCLPDSRHAGRADPAEIGQLGIVRQRVAALQALATAVAPARLVLHRTAPLQATLDTLRALPGVGDWTAQVIAMRVLAGPMPGRPATSA